MYVYIFLYLMYMTSKMSRKMRKIEKNDYYFR